MADSSVQETGRILVGKSDVYQYLTLALGNRHGLVAGATGTGKTVTLQVLAEGFSRAGTSVFTADVKGDLAGISMPGDSTRPHFVQRAKDIGIAYEADDFPVVFWDLYGQSGHPVRASISAMGPVLLARLLELNDFRRECSTSALNSPMSKGFCSLISRISGRSCNILERTPHK